jgi:hypothetical protein
MMVLMTTFMGCRLHRLIEMVRVNLQAEHRPPHIREPWRRRWFDNREDALYVRSVAELRVAAYR